VIDAIERDDLHALREEIGDHIFEGVFLAQVAADRGLFDVADVLDIVTSKLVRRHPHVFQNDGTVHDAESRERAPSADAALARWDAQKSQDRTESGQRATALAGLPVSLPALLRAFKIGKRAAAVGFDWKRVEDVVAKIEEEVSELREAMNAETTDPTRAEEEMGDFLFSVANLSRQLGIEPEAALRRANAKFTTRFEAMERRIAESGRRMQGLALEELEAEWQETKAQLGQRENAE
jgi:MazG family protein